LQLLASRTILELSSSHHKEVAASGAEKKEINFNNKERKFLVENSLSPEIGRGNLPFGKVPPTNLSSGSFCSLESR